MEHGSMVPSEEEHIQAGNAVAGGGTGHMPTLSVQPRHLFLESPMSSIVKIITARLNGTRKDCGLVPYAHVILLCLCVICASLLPFAYLPLMEGVGHPRWPLRALDVFSNAFAGRTFIGAICRIIILVVVVLGDVWICRYITHKFGRTYATVVSIIIASSLVGIIVGIAASLLIALRGPV